MLVGITNRHCWLRVLVVTNRLIWPEPGVFQIKHPLAIWKTPGSS